MTNEEQSAVDQVIKESLAELEHCANCRYSLLTDTGRYRCRINGPQGELIQESWDPTRPQSPAKVQTVWPTVLAWDWCGRWEAPRPGDRRSLGGPAVVAAPEVDKSEPSDTSDQSPRWEGNLPGPVKGASETGPVLDEDPAAARKRAADEAAGATAPAEQPPLEEVPAGKPDPKASRGPVKVRK